MIKEYNYKMNTVRSINSTRQHNQLIQSLLPRQKHTNESMIVNFRMFSFEKHLIFHIKFEYNYTNDYL